MVSRRRSGESGFTLAALAVVVTVLGVMLAMALPFWSTYIQREKEEELIFRGLQYAEAIRLFERRFGRDPVRLEELIEVKPRCIRQLWKDPITDSKNWGLVFAGAAGRRGGPRGQAPEPTGPTGIGPESDTTPRDPVGSAGSKPAADGEQDDGAQSPQRGPIQGVFSRSTKKAIKVFLDRSQYNQWLFTVQLVLSPAPGGGAVPASTLPRLSSRWIGRPLPMAGAGGPRPGQPGAGDVGKPRPGPLEAPPVGSPTGDGPIDTAPVDNGG
jgi:type II secretory pathway pseudopilin PulG